METIRVLLAEDHTLVRAGIHALLSSLPDIEVVAEAGDGHEALGLIAAGHPDVVLMDIAMPGLNGLEAPARITHDFPAVRVIILSMHASEEYVLQALRAGAAGYLLKDAGTSELEAAIRTVARGDVYLTPAVSRHVVSDYLRRVSGLDEASQLARLTPRQREILRRIAEGYTTQAIANELRISIKTVETHRAQLMERLDIHDVAGLVRFAIRAGLVGDSE